MRMQRANILRLALISLALLVLVVSLAQAQGSEPRNRSVRQDTVKTYLDSTLKILAPVVIGGTDNNATGIGPIPFFWKNGNGDYPEYDSITFIQGTNVTLSRSGHQLTISSSGGGGSFRWMSEGYSWVTDSLRFIPGANITITQSGHTITIASTGGGGAPDSSIWAKKWWANNQFIPWTDTTAGGARRWQLGGYYARGDTGGVLASKNFSDNKYQVKIPNLADTSKYVEYPDSATSSGWVRNWQLWDKGGSWMEVTKGSRKFFVKTDSSSAAFKWNLTGQAQVGDSLRFIQGSNITLTQSGYTLTIASTGGGSAMTKQNILDTLNSASPDTILFTRQLAIRKTGTALSLWYNQSQATYLAVQATGYVKSTGLGTLGGAWSIPYLNVGSGLSPRLYSGIGVFPVLTGTQQYAIYTGANVDSTVTGMSACILAQSGSQTTFNAFTIPYFADFWCRDFTKRDYATITNLYGIYIDQLSAGTNNWSIYSAGTEPSYFAGSFGIGVDAVRKLDVKSTSDQERLRYDDTYYTDIGTRSNGDFIVQSSPAGLGYKIIQITATSEFIGVGAGATANALASAANCGIGQGTLWNVKTGSYNIGIGHQVMYYDTSGSNNIAMGFYALQTATDPVANIAIGGYTLLAGLHTQGAVAIGYMAGRYQQATALNSQFIGYMAGTGASVNCIGTANTAIGNSALGVMTSASRNVAIGYGTLYSDTSGSDNVIIGYYAALYTTSGNYNTIIGSYAGAQSGVQGSSNVFLGYQAGYSETGSNQLYIANNSSTTLIRGDFSNGWISVPEYRIQALNSTPASSGATGVLGEIRWDANYMYVCTATNTWKRAAISTW